MKDIEQRILDIEERQEFIKEYLDIQKNTPPFLVQILPHKYVEQYERECWIENKIPTQSFHLIIFLTLLGINAVLFMLVYWLIN